MDAAKNHVALLPSERVLMTLETAALANLRLPFVVEQRSGFAALWVQASIRVRSSVKDEMLSPDRWRPVTQLLYPGLETS